MKTAKKKRSKEEIAAARKQRADELERRRKPEMDRAQASQDHRSRSVTDIAARIERREERTKAETTATTRIRRQVVKAERRTAVGGEIGGTGQTVIKFSGSPIARLVDKKHIGLEELRAAEEIVTAAMAICGGMRLKPQSMERRDPTHSSYEPVKVTDAVLRYQAWARHWSARAKLGDPTLEIVYAAVVDEWAFHVIEARLRIRHGLARKATVRGLRDYAARADWIEKNTARQWIRQAESVFTIGTTNTELRFAIARAAATP